MIKKIDSLYLHFPFCAHLCNYCDFFKRVSENKKADYQNFHQFLEESFNLHQNLINSHQYSWDKLQTLYIGGGTPSLWGIEGSSFLEMFLKQKNITLAPDCEFTMEVNPKTWTPETLAAWRKIGVNRFSLGVQSLNPTMMKYLDRFHSIEDVYETLDYFSKNNLNFSMDLMLGLPFSKENNRDVIAELEQALKYSPKHFSVYILTVKDNYPHFKNLPDEEWIEKEYLDVANFLKKNGYTHYEISNFSLTDFQSIHNLYYWKSKTVAALGPSATGFLSEASTRYKWKVNKPEYEVEVLTKEEIDLEKVYMALRSEVGVNLEDILPEEQVRKKIITKWHDLGYTDKKSSHVQLNSNGFLMLDSLMSDLFSSGLK